MGNRILKESILTSLEIDALTWFEEVIFYRLIISADDYGVCHADPVLLAHTLFPRKENITRKMVEEALKHLEQLDLIQRYIVTGKGAFLHISSWEQHQRLRSTRRKYPAPEEAVEEEQPGEEGKTKTTKQRTKKAEPANPQTETETKENTDLQTEREEKSITEIPKESPAVITLPLNDGSEFPVTQKDIEEYASLYQAVDIETELRAMRGWCLSNTRKRKTKDGIRRFINGWLARVQDRGGTIKPYPAKTPYPDNPYLTMGCEGETV